MSDTYISCNVSQGMFNDERVAVVRPANAKPVSLLVDKELIRSENHRDGLRVTKISEDPKTGWILVLLPVDAIESGSRWLHVKRNQMI